MFLLETKQALVWRKNDLNVCQDPVMTRNLMVGYSNINDRIMTGLCNLLFSGEKMKPVIMIDLSVDPVTFSDQ